MRRAMGAPTPPLTRYKLRPRTFGERDAAAAHAEAGAAAAAVTGTAGAEGVAASA
ncbi:hypothetical protein MNEG_15331, partial [Monoraphidium neglectum]